MKSPMVTTLPYELLDLASLAASSQNGSPTQASLRRSISTAYYALFHLLVGDIIQNILPAEPRGLNLRIARSLTHSEMREACTAVSRPQLQKVLSSLCPQGFSAELRMVAEAFIELQDDRHNADYDLADTYTSADALSCVLVASDAFGRWQIARQRDEATVFLAALLFARRWSR